MTEKKIEIFTGDSGFWKEIVESTKADIERLEKLIRFQRAVFIMAENKLKEAEGKLEGEVDENNN